jgi:tetratricopeptide (TPR) repeat protein
MLRRAPITVPCLAAVALLAWWAIDQGGYAVSRWAPGTAVVLILLGVALVLLPNAWGDVPGPVRLGVVALGGFTAWSFLSLLWAGDRGAAWEGSLRTLLYFATFSLFALWPQRGRTALVLVAAWVLVVDIVAVVLLVRLGTTSDPRRFFGDDRLLAPAGYPNASAALLLMAFWPAVLLAAGRRVPWPLRAALAGGAVVLADVALLAQSRGALLAFPLTAVLVLAVTPGRLRSVAALTLVLAGAAAAAPATLHVADALRGAGDVKHALAADALLVALAALVVAGLGALVAFWETRRPPAAPTVARLRRAGRALAIVAGVAVVAGGLVAAGNPLDRVHTAYTSFKGGYESTSGKGSRLVGGLGSNRYDFYRVALAEFRAHPVAGLGADNFRQAYLVRGTSDETPRYPHSIELRTLAQTGLVGTVLLLAALAGAFAAAARALRSADELTATVAAACASVPAYWLVHGSADWFFEYAGLGAAAFACLGLAAALDPRPDPPRAFVRRFRTPAEVSVVVVAVLVASAGPVTLWMADSEVTTAGRTFAARPAEALDRLNRAAALNPFSAQPASVAGSIALRIGQLRRADSLFANALQRVPDDAYATLERGAIASAEGDPAAAARLLRRAVALAPRDVLARQALVIVTAGGTVDVGNLNRAILLRGRHLG